MNRILRTIFKTIAKEKQGVVADWKYKQLDDTPFLFGSNELKKYASHAIKKGDEQSAISILNYIRRFNASDIESYKIVIKIIKKSFKNIDITDLL